VSRGQSAVWLAELDGFPGQRVLDDRHEVRRRFVSAHSWWIRTARNSGWPRVRRPPVSIRRSSH